MLRHVNNGIGLSQKAACKETQNTVPALILCLRAQAPPSQPGPSPMQKAESQRALPAASSVVHHCSFYDAERV